MKTLYDQLIDVAKTIGHADGDANADLSALDNAQAYVENLRAGRPDHDLVSIPESFKTFVKSLDLDGEQIGNIYCAYVDAYHAAEDRAMLRLADAVEEPADWLDVETRKIVREATLLEKWHIMCDDERRVRLETGERVKLVYRGEEK